MFQEMSIIRVNYLPPGMTMYDAIEMAGGYNIQFKNRAYVVRANGEREKLIF